MFSALFEPIPINLSSQAGIPKGFRELSRMKIIRQLGQGKTGHITIKLSQSEWQDIGNKTGWSEEVDDVDDVEKNEPTKPTDPIEKAEQLQPVDLSKIRAMEITVEKYTDRSFAVYVNGDLLCVTAYKKGANAVRDLLVTLHEDIVGLDMMNRFHMAENAKIEREKVALIEQLEAAMGKGERDERKEHGELGERAEP
jgi:hypothetical protein